MTRIAAAVLACVLLAAIGCAKQADRVADAAATAPTPPAGAHGSGKTATPGPPPPAGDPDEIVVDPFCGLKLRKGEAAAAAEWNGRTYWFCLADHRDAFLADPRKALCRLGGADAGVDCDAR